VNRSLSATAALVAAGQFITAGAQVPSAVRFELPNGLRVWVQEDHTRPIVLVQTTYKVGSINDPPGLTGTAHYVEHMAYRATQNIRNEDIYGFVDRIGGRYTGGTAQLATTYTETVPAWALDEALRTNAERMARVLFDSAEFERERTNVLTEANGYVATTAAQILRNEVLSASFQLHPYRQNSATWAQDNIVVTRDQAREFYRNYYGPNNVVLAIVGDVDPARVRALVERHFVGLARAPRSGAVTIVEPPQRAERRVSFIYPDDQAHLEIAYRSPQAADPAYPVLVVLDRLLRDRLRVALDGAPPIDVATSQSATPYPFVYRISASGLLADPEQVVAALQKELDKLLREGVGSVELAAAHTENGAGRGGRGGRGGATASVGATPSGGMPPRQSSLTQIATDLTNKEVFPWDVSAELRAKIRRAEEGVTSQDIRDYVDHWLRPSLRTVGIHVPGRSNSRADWSNGREIAGERLAIPPLTTAPAKRLRPTPVPLQALQPLKSLPIVLRRTVLANGVVVRAARTPTGDSLSALHVRIRLGSGAEFPGRESVALVAARMIADNPRLQAAGATVATGPLANDGYIDIRVSMHAAQAPGVVATVAAALRVTSFSTEQIDAERGRLLSEPIGGRGGRGGGRGNAVTVDARARMLQAVAPAWQLADPGGRAVLAAVTPHDVSDYLARHLVGEAVTVALVTPRNVADLIDAADQAFAQLPKGRAGEGAATTISTPQSPAQEERIPVGTEPQVTILAGLPGVPRNSPDRRALELLNYIVGVPSYGGRLGWALTKTGLTYSSAATTTFGAATGHILFSTKCDTKNLESTLQAIREVVGGVAANGVDAWELREAQAFTLGRTLLYGTRDDSGADAIAGALLDSESLGEELLDLPAFSRAYLGVTLEQVNAAARRYYRPEFLKIVAIGAVPTRPERPIFAAGTFRALFER
jgi:zinc protease